MCNDQYSESGAPIAPARCADFLLLQSDRDRLAGVVAGMEEQNARNLDALRRAERRAIERETDNAMRITALRRQRDNMERENARMREALKFYANGDHYRAMPGVVTDIGEVARNALKEVG